MTGEKAAREKAMSISLQTWPSAAWITASVMGSMALMAPAPHGDAQVADGVDRGRGARLDHGGGVHLLHDGRPGEARAERQLHPVEHLRRLPAPVGEQLALGR